MKTFYVILAGMLLVAVYAVGFKMGEHETKVIHQIDTQPKKYSAVETKIMVRTGYNAGYYKGMIAGQKWFYHPTIEQIEDETRKEVDRIVDGVPLNGGW